MNMLVMTLQTLGQNPFAWGAVGVLAVIALISLWRYRTCDQLCEDPAGDREQARAYLNRRVAEGPRYFLLMIAGIAAMIAGLALIAGDVRPAIGFFVLVAGALIVQTEPLRQRIRTAAARVIAAGGGDADRRGVAQASLRDSHRSLVTANFLLVAALTLMLLAF